MQEMKRLALLFAFENEVDAALIFPFRPAQSREHGLLLRTPFSAHSTLIVRLRTVGRIRPLH